MSHPPPHDLPEPDDDSRDPVWGVLQRAREVTPSPHFTRRVMAAMHAETAARHRRWDWLQRLLSPSLRPAVALATLILMIAGAWFVRSFNQNLPAIAHRSVPEAATPAPTDDDSEALVQAFATDLALLDEVDQLLDPEDGLDLEEEDVGRLLF